MQRALCSEVSSDQHYKPGRCFANICPSVEHLFRMLSVEHLSQMFIGELLFMGELRIYLRNWA